MPSGAFGHMPRPIHPTLGVPLSILFAKFCAGQAYLEQPGLQVRVDKYVVPVELEAVLVVDDGLLHRQ